MTLLKALDSRIRFPSTLALSGGGGKTTALFALARELAARGARVLVTTTTRIRDPRGEGRRIDGFLEVPDPAGALPGDPSGLLPSGGGAGSGDAAGGKGPPGRGSVSVLCAGVEDGKLVGVGAGIFPALAASGRWDAILAEADGARMRPVKAPAPYEPVWPVGVSVALGVIGLDCLGRPLDNRVAHRPELLGARVGLEPGGPIELGHLLLLARNPEGLFRGAPMEARRILVLNKADLRPDLDPEALAAEAAAGLAGLGSAAPTGPQESPSARIDPGLPARIDLVLVCSLADPDPERRVRAARAVFGDGPGGVY